jgi:hypothetical protein
LDTEKGELVKVGAFDHHYPATKIMWGPVKRTKETDMVATTGDYLRLWNVKDRAADADSADGFKVDVSLEKLLNPVRPLPVAAPCLPRQVHNALSVARVFWGNFCAQVSLGLTRLLATRCVLLVSAPLRSQREVSIARR